MLAITPTGRGALLLGMAATHRERLERLFSDVWGGEDPSTADELVHEDYVIHGRELADEMRGPALYRALASGTRDAFPDATFALENVLVDGDRVAARWRMEGTHEGALFGVEPTGREVAMTGIEIARFADDLLRESWVESDELGLMRQVGALDDPP
jgi:predicted ester cyclase